MTKSHIMGTYRSSTYINWIQFKSAQYCSHFLSVLKLCFKKFVSFPSFGLAHLLVPSTFLTWSVIQFLYVKCEPMFPVCFRVHKIPLVFTTYLTIHLTIFHHLVRSLPYFLDLFFKNFLLLAFHMLSSVHNLTNQLPLKSGTFIIYRNQFGCPIQEKFSRICCIFLLCYNLH